MFLEKADFEDSGDLCSEFNYSFVCLQFSRPTNKPIAKNIEMINFGY